MDRSHDGRLHMYVVCAESLVYKAVLDSHILQQRAVSEYDQNQ